MSLIKKTYRQLGSVLAVGSSAGLLVVPMLVATVAVLVGCSPSLEPLYRDFASDNMPADSLQLVVREAAEAAGWTTVPSAAANVIATEERTVRRWGLYQVMVSVELTPINRDHVRVLIHPYRVYFTGHRAKLPYLKRSVRRAVLPDLVDELKKRGVETIGSAQHRDRVAGA